MAGNLDPKTGLLTQAPQGTTINETGVVNRTIQQPVSNIQAVQSPDLRSVISNTQQPGYIQGYDTNQNFKPVFVPKGQYVPGISATPKQITTDSFNNTGNVKLPGIPATTNEADAFVAGAGKTIESIYNQLQTPVTEAQTKQQTLNDQVASLLGEQADLSVQQSAAEQQAGIPELNKQFADVNSQIQARIAEYNALLSENKNKPITMNSIIGNERAILDARAADIGLLQAQAQGLQGQIQAAQDTVNRAIDLKYKTNELRLATYEAQLKALEPTLNREEKQQALAQQVLIDRQKQEIADKKEKEKNIQNIMMAYIQAGGKDQNITNQISASNTIENALSILGANKPPETQIIDLGNRKVLINSQTGQTIKDLGIVGKIGGGGGSVSAESNGTYIPGVNPIVDSWAERIQSGQAKITDIPASQASLRNAVTVALSAMGNTTEGKPTVTELGRAALTTAKSLKEKLDGGEGTSAVGKSGFLNTFGYGFVPGTARANFVTDFNSLKSQLALEGVKYLKGQGQVSDAERALLSQAVTKLSLSQSQEEFGKTLQSIIDKLSGAPESSTNQSNRVLISPDGKSQVNISDLTEEQIKEAKDAGWK